MPIELTCSCGKRLQVAEEFSGRQGRCPACGELLQIPGRDDTTTAPSSDEASPALFVTVGLPTSKGAGVPPDAITSITGAEARLHAGERRGARADDDAKLTVVGYILTLLSVAVIAAVAIPIVRWRDPVTGLPLPRFIAIISPLLIGAAFNGIGTLLLKLLGLPVWSKQESGEKK
jgi:hypothetical protein